MPNCFRRGYYDWSRPLTFALVCFFKNSFKYNTKCEYRSLSRTSLYPGWVLHTRRDSFLLCTKASVDPIENAEKVDVDKEQTIQRGRRSKGSTTTFKQRKPNPRKKEANTEVDGEQSWSALQEIVPHDEGGQLVHDEIQVGDSKPATKKKSTKKKKETEPELVIPEYAMEDFFEHNDSIHEDMRYGTCKLCSGPIVIPGLDNYLCKECGWVSNSPTNKQ